MTCTRPILRWHGGKWMLAPWIIEHFPKHRVYVEPFGGAASVLARKKPCYAEIYNDLDDGAVGLFRVLRDSDQAKELIRRLRLTPFAQVEFENAYEPCSDPVEAARRLIIRSFMGFGSNGHHRSTGFRANSNRSGTTPAHDWVNYPDALERAIARFAKVTISHKDAISVMQQHDGTDTLHYVDPPYPHGTRSQRKKNGEIYHGYSHELTDDDHKKLLEFLNGIDGMCVLSSYPSQIYDDTLVGWHKVERAALADGARKRVEVLWLNPAAVAGLRSPQFFKTMGVT